MYHEDKDMSTSQPYRSKRTMIILPSRSVMCVLAIAFSASACCSNFTIPYPLSHSFSLLNRSLLFNDLERPTSSYWISASMALCSEKKSMRRSDETDHGKLCTTNWAPIIHSPVIIVSENGSLLANPMRNGRVLCQGLTRTLATLHSPHCVQCCRDLTCWHPTRHGSHARLSMIVYHRFAPIRSSNLHCPQTTIF